MPGEANYRYRVCGKKKATLGQLGGKKLDAAVKYVGSKQAPIVARDAGGRIVAAVVSGRQYRILKKIERSRRDARDTAEGLAALAKANAEGTIPWEEVKADLGL